MKDISDYFEGILPKNANIFIISDENVAKIYAQGLVDAIIDYAVSSASNDNGFSSGIEERIHLIKVPAGEASKSFDNLGIVLERMLSIGAERKSLIIALGGGVIGDLAGVAASLLLRGVPFIQIPTTLLSQVDSSVGGKTGVNSKYGKNLIGSFYQPKAVITDLSVLDSLSEREKRAGYAEIAKYGLLGDGSFFSWLEDNYADILSGNAKKSHQHQDIAGQSIDARSYAIYHSCKMKAEIVAQDERESGKRALLNLGHTFGHALEAELGYDNRLLHGEAVAIGMVMAFAFAEQLDICTDGCTDRVAAHLSNAGLPVSPLDIAPNWNIDNLIAHMKLDKKVADGKIRLILPKSIGDSFIYPDATEQDLRIIWQRFTAA